MDPKMDTGMILEDYAKLPQYNINRLLDPREFIWVFDNILVGQMTWLSGHALSQTLFTSCYILRLFEIDLKDDSSGTPTDTEGTPSPPVQFVTVVLKACVLAIAKTAGIIWNEMKKGQVYEEEDFMTNKFGVTLYDKFPSSYVAMLLDQAECWMEKLGKQWIDSHYGPESSDIYREVVAPKCSQFPQAIMSLKNVRKHIQEIRSTNILGVQVDGAFDYTVHRKLVTNTPPRAIALLSLEENFFIYFAGQKPAPGAFARSVLQTVLYEYQVIMGSRMVQDVISESIQETVTPAPWIFELFNESSTRSRASIEHGLSAIPEQDEDEVSLLKRQIQTKLDHFIDKAIKPFVDTLQIAGQNTSRQKRNLRKIVQLWETLQEEAELFDEEIHIVLDEIRGPQEQDNVDSSQADGSLRPFYFVSWAYHMKLWVMEWLILLGFELELYSAFEYSMIYGYVDCVLGAHAQHLRRIQTIAESESQTGSKDSSTLKKKKKKKKKTSATEDKVSSLADTNQSDLPSDTAPLQPNTDPSSTGNASASATTIISTPAIRAVQDMVTIRLQLARGVFLILAALTKVGHLSTAPAHLSRHGLNDLETLYRHRFKAFHHLSSPELMTYENYLQRLDCEGLDAWQILEYSTDFFNQAKAGLDRLQSFSARDARVNLCEDAWRQDIKSMIKVCIANKVSIVALQKDARIIEQKEFSAGAQKRAAATVKRQSQGKDSKCRLKAPIRKLHFEWKYHSWWPVVNLA
ncbi:hypothetical protein BGZ49_004065 [Haplosporangium sp. Z 27]|nr:hypothetical protein BGZ49_004065 [Haplosporangium sp. Z 27]